MYVFPPASTVQTDRRLIWLGFPWGFHVRHATPPPLIELGLRDLEMLLYIHSIPEYSAPDILWSQHHDHGADCKRGGPAGVVQRRLVRNLQMRDDRVHSREWAGSQRAPSHRFPPSVWRRVCAVLVQPGKSTEGKPQQEGAGSGRPTLVWLASLVEPLRFWRFDLASPTSPSGSLRSLPAQASRGLGVGLGVGLGGLQPATSQSTRPHWPVAAATRTCRPPAAPCCGRAQCGPQPAAAFVVTAILGPGSPEKAQQKPWLLANMESI